MTIVGALSDPPERTFVVEQAGLPVRFASADEPTLRGPGWVAQQWEAARLAAGRDGAILVLDEVQKASGWPASVRDCGMRTRAPGGQ